MTWTRGRAEIERLLARGHLERVALSPAVVRRLLANADAHVTLARRGAEDDAAGALQLCYDAARKCAAALLAVQGLRATARGGHVALIDACRAQFDGSDGVVVFAKLNRLRRRRNATEYPSEDSPGVTLADATQALAVAVETADVAKRLLSSAKLGPFGTGAAGPK